MKRKIAFLLVILISLLNDLALCQGRNSVQSRPIVIRLPSPTAVDNRNSDNKDSDVDVNDIKSDKAKPREQQQSSTTAAESLQEATVTPVTPAGAFRQEIGGTNPTKIATANDISQFLNPVQVSPRLQQPGSFGNLPIGNGLNPPVPGLLAPQFGLPQSLPGAGSSSGLLGSPSGSSNGILGVLQSLGKQLTGAVGLNNILPQSSPSVGGGGSPNFPQIRRIPGAPGPPIAGLPNIPGLPLFPGGSGGALTSNAAISRRAFNGTSLADLLPPNQAQQFADNITDTLLPNTVELDLAKFMGRWFEGINSPRATDQRCIVHHYGGLTENGKTSTFTALKIYREGSEFGQVRYSIGYAFKGGRQDGMLQMHSSEAADPTPYWIYRAGPIGRDPFGNAQYEYAVVSNWIRYPVVVLVRDPDQFRQKYEEDVLRWLEDNQFINGFVRAFNLVQPADYANCQYADSTFEIFG